MHLHHIQPFAKNFLKVSKDAQSAMLFSSVGFYSTDTCIEFIGFNMPGPISINNGSLVLEYQELNGRLRIKSLQGRQKPRTLPLSATTVVSPLMEINDKL